MRLERAGGQEVQRGAGVQLALVPALGRRPQGQGRIGAGRQEGGAKRRQGGGRRRKELGGTREEQRAG